MGCELTLQWPQYTLCATYLVGPDIAESLTLLRRVSLLRRKKVQSCRPCSGPKKVVSMRMGGPYGCSPWVVGGGNLRGPCGPPVSIVSLSRRRRRGMKDLFQSIEASGLIVLECGGCGEHLFLLGREEDWPKEHRDAFPCSACGKTVTLAHSLDGTANAIKSLLQSSIRPLSQGPASGGSLPFSPH
jgi:hypothetical protein